jgi:hypothetical protein
VTRSKNGTVRREEMFTLPSQVIEKNGRAKMAARLLYSRNMRASILATCVSMSLLSGCIIADDDNEIEIINVSRWDIFELYLTEDGLESPFDEQLRGLPLLSGQSIVLGGIPCGTYDVIVYDEDDVRCDLRNVSVCLGETAVWRIDTATLIGCEFN